MEIILKTKLTKKEVEAINYDLKQSPENTIQEYLQRRLDQWTNNIVEDYENGYLEPDEEELSKN